MTKYKITTERADLFDINMTVVIGISVKGNASRESITAAFERAVEAHEILNTRVRINADGSAEYIAHSEHNNIVCFTQKDHKDIFREQEKIRFRVEDGEYLRLFIRYTDNGFNALFLMHHLAGDGKSLSYFIESFMRALYRVACSGSRGAVLEKSPVRILSTDELPKNSRPLFLTKVLISNYNSMWKKEKRVFNFDDLQRSFDGFWSEHETEIILTTYDKEKVAEMKEEAKKCKCRLTAYLIAKYLEEKKCVQDVGLAVDGRLDGNRSMGNQATGISIKTSYNEKKSFAHNARRIQKMLDKKLKSPMYKYFILHFMAGFDPTLVDAVNMQYTGAFDGKTSRKLAGLLGYGEVTKALSLTNLTTLDIPERYGEYEIEKAIFVPPVVSYGKNVVGIVTFRGEMQVAEHRYINK